MSMSLIGFVSVVVCRINGYKGLWFVLTTCQMTAQDFDLDLLGIGLDKDRDQGLRSQSGG